MSSSPTERLEDGDSNPLGLDEAELQCLSSQIDLPPSDAGYPAIYRYANAVDCLVMAVSVVMAAGAGAATPLMTLVMGSLIGNFSNLDSHAELGSFLQDVNTLILYFVYIGVATLVTTSAFVYGFTWTGKRISSRLRAAYLEALLRQNIGYLDSLGAGEVATRITADMNVVQDGISQKVGLTVAGLSGFAAALVISFVKSWRLALVMFCLPVGVTLWMAAAGGTMKKAQATSLNIYSSTASFAEEAISSLRNVAAYGSQHRFVKRYDASLVPATKAEFMAKAAMGVLMGGVLGMMLSSFALAPWAGWYFYSADEITLSEILTVMFSSMIAAVSFGHTAPHLQSFASAGAAANRIFAVIERRSTTETDHGEGHKPEDIQGHIEFKNIKLAYPSRPNQLVLDGFTLDIPAGKTTAVVGPSGSGKSSLFYLMQAFYSPLRGQLLIDGCEVKALNLKWLRSQMRMVSQESFLFDTTVFENIAFGLAGTDLENIEMASKIRLVEEAAKAANAHEFIRQLPQGYQTRVGEHGDLLSGGQRQRIAIARAVVSDPKILLLDEATAALDTRSESLVQNALNTRALTGERTTIVIAHRLSTVRHADKIVVVEHGRITEQGTHEELLAKGGTYASLATTQSFQGEGGRGAGDSHDPSDEKARDDAVSLRRHSTKASIKERDQQLAQPSTWELIKFLLRLNRPEAGYLVLGMIASALAGLAYPLTAVFFGNLVLAFRDPGQTPGGHGIGFWAGMQWLAGWVAFFTNLTQNLFFAFAASRLISRARTRAFAAILRQDMEFFAQPGNSSGALTAFLAKQANLLNGLSGVVLGAVLSSVSAVVIGFIVAVSFSWKLGLVAAAIMPAIFLTGFARFRILTNLEKRNLQDTNAAAIVSEAIRGIRTVAALGLEPAVLARYRGSLGEEMRSAFVKDAVLAFLYGASQSVIVFGSAIIFWYGGAKLLPTGECNVRTFLICFMATTYSAQSAGGIFSYAPDMAGAQEATAKLKALCEAVPRIDADADAGDEAGGIVGDVELRDVDFAYPSAEGKTHPVLRDVSLKADFGRFLALVGASGSGKSTVLNLLERLYDPKAGRVLADGKDIRAYNLQDYRKQLAIVEQDSVLYSGTIRENIIGDSEVDENDIVRACRDANIWEFVESLPDGIDTLVGPRGSQVSGGQKQRLALARALLRNPKVLLLDEATSALDSASEAVVQRALTAAAVGRTTIAVAHRLSSIAHADCIYVFDKGSIVERGTHMELMAKKGRYWEYVGMQNLSK